MLFVTQQDIFIHNQYYLFISGSDILIINTVSSINVNSYRSTLLMHVFEPKTSLKTYEHLFIDNFILKTRFQRH